MAKRAASIERSITCPQNTGERRTLPEKNCPPKTPYERTLRAENVGRSKPRWFSKSPGSVSLDLGISHVAFRAYCILGLKTRGNICSLGQRELGKFMGVGKEKAGEYFSELVESGHMEKLAGGLGKRDRYRFTSPAFLKACLVCKRFTDKLRDDGTCWLCASKVKKSA